MFGIPDWVFEFHGHYCPFMPIGYRMGILALKRLGIDRVRDHGVFCLPEMGDRHPQTCMIDGLQAATGCTYGKLLMERLNYGKYAAIFYRPGKVAIRISVRPEFIDRVHRADFFKYRQRGIEPSKIPYDVCKKAIEPVLTANEDEMFKVEGLPDFRFERPKGSWQRARCEKCGEYVFEPYIRVKNGQDLCIPCSGYRD